MRFKLQIKQIKGKREKEEKKSQKEKDVDYEIYV